MNLIIDAVQAAAVLRLARRLQWGPGREGGRGAGMQQGRRLGSSGEFEGYRRFLPGDDLRALDLRVFARLRRPVARVAREDSSRSVTLLVDRSASCSTPARTRAQALLGLLLAALARRHGDPVRLFLHGNERLVPAPVPNAWGGWNDLLGAHPPALGAQSDWQRELSTLPPDPAGRGLVILLSDAIGIEEPMATFARLARHGRITLCMLLEDDETHPALSGRVLLRSRESEAPWRGLVTAATRADYRRQLAAYQARLRASLAARDGELLTLRAADSPARLVETLRRPGSLLR